MNFWDSLAPPTPKEEPTDNHPTHNNEQQREEPTYSNLTQPTRVIPPERAPQQAYQNINTWCTQIQSELADIRSEIVGLRSGLVSDFGQIKQRIDEVLQHVPRRAEGNGRGKICEICGDQATAFAMCPLKCLCCARCIASARQGDSRNRMKNFCPKCHVRVTQFRYFKASDSSATL